MELISQSRSDFSVNQFTPTSCMCLYTRWDINTRSQNSSEIEVKFIAVQWGESSENISVSYIYVDFYERFPSDGCMPSSLRPERIVRSNIRLRKKATRIGYINEQLWSLLHHRDLANAPRPDASLTHQNQPGFDKRGSYSFADLLVYWKHLGPGITPGRTLPWLDRHLLNRPSIQCLYNSLLINSVPAIETKAKIEINSINQYTG